MITAIAFYGFSDKRQVCSFSNFQDSMRKWKKGSYRNLISHTFCIFKKFSKEILNSDTWCSACARSLLGCKWFCTQISMEFTMIYIHIFTSIFQNCTIYILVETIFFRFTLFRLQSVEVIGFIRLGLSHGQVQGLYQDVRNQVLFYIPMILQFVWSVQY